MSVDLLQHNKEAYEKIKDALESGEKKFAVANATGTGKSYLIARICEEYGEDKKLVLIPSKYIKEQMQKLFDKYDIVNTDFMLYQKLIKMSDEDISAMDYKLIALDEYHHDTAKKWGERVKHLMDSHTDSIFFGTSATPIRSDGVNVIDELFESNCASELSLAQAIAKKIVPIPTYVSALYTLDDELEILRRKIKDSSNTKEEKEEFYKTINTMRSEIEKSYGMPIILNHHIKDKEGKYIVFCKNKAHFEKIKETVVEWFKTAGFKSIHDYVVHSSYENKDAEYKAFCDDKSHSLKLLFCVNMLNEGLHLKNISGVLLLRPTNSNIIWHQQIGRAIEANNTGNPVIIDATNNFQSVGQGIELLREIKEAVRKEKDGNGDFDDSNFLDIDTFFVTGFVQDVQRMFTEIEEGLQGSWDLYIRALEQYKEREGDCLVQGKHVEVMEDGLKVKLGRWISYMRQSKKGKGRHLLTEDRITQLEEIGFIWNNLKFNFEKNVCGVKGFYSNNGYYPKDCSKNENESKLGNFVNKERTLKRKAAKEGKEYPQWRFDFINKAGLVGFFDEKESGFDRFYRYLLLYKKEHGHVNVKAKDVIAGYNIGMAYNDLKKENRKDNITEEQIKKLMDMGVDITADKYEKRFTNTMELAKEAIIKGVVITYQNQIYKGVNLYTWYLSHKKKFTEEEIKMINVIVSNIYRMPVKIIDIKRNKEYVYPSQTEAGRALCNEFHLVGSNRGGLCTVNKYLMGKTKKPIYKNRFIFQYADAEEISS